MTTPTSLISGVDNVEAARAEARSSARESSYYGLGEQRGPEDDESGHFANQVPLPSGPSCAGTPVRRSVPPPGTRHLRLNEKRA